MDQTYVQSKYFEGSILKIVITYKNNINDRNFWTKKRKENKRDYVSVWELTPAILVFTGFMKNRSIIN